MKPVAGSRLGLSIIVLVHFFLAVSYSVLTPSLEGWDEVAHFVTLRHIARPDIYAEASPAGLPSEIAQPPLYYWIVGKVAAPLLPAQPWDPELNHDWDPDIPPGGASSRGGANYVVHTPAEGFPYHGIYAFIHFSRVLTAVLSCFLTIFVYLSARLLFTGGRQSLYLLAAGIASFLPTWLELSGLITNDVLAAVFASVLLYLSIRVAKRRDRSLIWLGVFVGLAVLAKSTTFMLVLLYGAFAAYIAVKQGSVRLGFVRFGEFLGGVLLLAGWWIFRSPALRQAADFMEPRIGTLMDIRRTPPASLLKELVHPVPLTLLFLILLPAGSVIFRETFQRLASDARFWKGLVAMALLLLVAIVALPLSEASIHLQWLAFMLRTFVAGFGPWVILAPGWIYVVYAILASGCVGAVLLVLFSDAGSPQLAKYAFILLSLVLVSGLLPMMRGIVYNQIVLVHGRLFMLALAPLSLLLSLSLAADKSIVGHLRNGRSVSLLPSECHHCCTKQRNDSRGRIQTRHLRDDAWGLVGMLGGSNHGRHHAGCRLIE